MNSSFSFRAMIVWLLVLSLNAPPALAVVGKADKKYFQAGAKYESAEQWEQAVQQYALAVADEPGNTEYRLRLVRAMQMASLMFTARGNLAEANADYAAAYKAYGQAYAYDKTNEVARVKMTRMLEQQRAQAGLEEAIPYNARTGALLPASHEIRTASVTPRRDTLQRIEFNEGASLKNVLTMLARQLDLNLVFDDSFKDATRFSLALNNVTAAKAFDIVLLQNKLLFEQLDRRTIMIYGDNPQNRQRLERLLVKTFYLNNAEPNETRGILQAHLGGQRQVSFSKQLNDANHDGVLTRDELRKLAEADGEATRRKLCNERC